MPSLIEQARRDAPGVGDEQLVARIAAGLIEKLDVSPPISLDMLASLRGIARVERVSLDAAACLVPADTGLVILLRETDSPGRQNFSGFHEIGHTFFPGFRTEKHFRCNPTKSLKALELLCDQAASELLLPQRFFEADTLQSAFALDSVRDLATEYAASLEATARRFATFWPEPSFILRLDVCNKPRDVPGAQPCLRASAFVPAGASWQAIPKWKSLDADDPLQAVLQDEVFVGRSPLGGLAAPGQVFWIDAQLQRWSDPQSGETAHRVLALVRPSKRKSSR